MRIQSEQWTDDISTVTYLQEIIYWEINEEADLYLPMHHTGIRIAGKWNKEHYKLWLEFKKRTLNNTKKA